MNPIQQRKETDEARPTDSPSHHESLDRSTQTNRRLPMHSILLFPSRDAFDEVRRPLG